MKLSAKAIEAIQTHAREQYPNEACGLIINGEYHPQVNTSSNPMQEFSFEYWPTDWSVEAVIHSHTNGNNFPGETDMLHQVSTGVPWGLVVASQDDHVTLPWFWGEGVAELDYVGRVWRHGPPGTDGGADCYALIQDYYRREYGVILKEFYRSPSWIEDGKNFFVANFEALNFERISESEVQPGDVFLMAVNSGGVSNHCGVYVGNGLGLHHLMNRLSRHEPIGSWKKLITHWLRYNGEKRGE